MRFNINVVNIISFVDGQDLNMLEKHLENKTQIQHVKVRLKYELQDLKRFKEMRFKEMSWKKDRSTTFNKKLRVPPPHLLMMSS